MIASQPEWDPESVMLLRTPEALQGRQYCTHLFLCCRKLYQGKDTFPLVAVCLDQWHLPRYLNTTLLKQFGNPCPGDFLLLLLLRQ